MKKLDLDKLKTGIPVISKKIGAFLAEAAAICLHMNGYQTGVKLTVEGEIEEIVTIEWNDKITDDVLNSWNDAREATEFGATALAILLLLDYTDFTHFIRAYQGTGIDYWLGKGKYTGEVLPTGDRKGRLEISGILKKSRGNTVNTRINQKKKQSKKTDSTKLPVYIVVVEFSEPKAKIIKK
ncbi:MAG: hypothetical protein ACPGVB_07275 [Chitinophagales bacterium]